MSLNQSYTIPPESQQASIPSELHVLDQWVLCGPRKMPINARTNEAASSTDAETWSAFTMMAGVTLPGFVFTPDDPYFVVDLDKCRNPETGEIEPWATAIVERFGTYTEISQSGTGLHLIGRGVLPKEGNRTGRIEVYDAGRYVALTGNTLAGYERIRNCQRTLTEWHHEVWPIETPKVSTNEPRPTPTIIHLEDRDLIERLRHQKGSGKAGRLLDGNAGDYDSPSEARSALGAYCAFYNADQQQIARVLFDHGPWSDEDWKDADERERKAGIDAEHVVTWYAQNGGKRYVGSPPPADYENVDTDTGEILEPEHADTDSEIVTQLRTENRRLRRDRQHLVDLILHPTLKHNEKMALVRAGQLAIRKKPDEDGRVSIKMAELTNDWRAKPEPGENTPLTNADGSLPYMSRGSGSGLMKKLAGDAQLGCKQTAQLIKATGEARKVSPKGGGQPWTETIWYVDRPASLGDFLEPAVTFSAERRRKLRTITPPCPDCGEVHPRTVKTTTTYTCHGCGGSWSEDGPERVEWPIVQIGPDQTGPMPVEDYEQQVAASGQPRQAATLFEDEAEPPDDDPAGDPEADDRPRHCIGCGAPLAGMEKHRCPECRETFRIRSHQHGAGYRKKPGICIDGDCDQPAAPGHHYCVNHGGRGEGMVAS